MIAVYGRSEISAIYFALLQNGYDFYAVGREPEHIACVCGFIGEKKFRPFWSGVKQSSCQVYPYWPRAAILETAAFYLTSDHARFEKYDDFCRRIMDAGNIADQERDQNLWDWMTDFPAALCEVLADPAFLRYLAWEKEWLAEQSVLYANELRQMEECLDVCRKKYDSPVKEIGLILSPIKCVYSADYHLGGKCFLFSSGAFRMDAVMHELLHHVLHPVVQKMADAVMQNRREYPGVDASYYLAGTDAGQINAFEEYAVRELTRDMMENRYPDDLVRYLRKRI